MKLFPHIVAASSLVAGFALATPPVRAQIYSANAVGIVARERGDLDGSGLVDIADAALLAELLAGEPGLSTCPAVADVDRSGHVGESDLVYLMNSWVGEVPQGALHADRLVGCLEEGSSLPARAGEVTVSMDLAAAPDGSDALLLDIEPPAIPEVEYWNTVIEYHGDVSPACVLEYELETMDEGSLQPIHGLVVFARDLPVVLVLQTRGEMPHVLLTLEAEPQSLPCAGSHRIRPVARQWCGTAPTEIVDP